MAIELYNNIHFCTASIIIICMNDKRESVHNNYKLKMYK